jgi:hypothetical protein
MDTFQWLFARVLVILNHRLLLLTYIYKNYSYFVSFLIVYPTIFIMPLYLLVNSGLNFFLLVYLKGVYLFSSSMAHFQMFTSQALHRSKVAPAVMAMWIFFKWRNDVSWTTDRRRFKCSDNAEDQQRIHLLIAAEDSPPYSSSINVRVQWRASPTRLWMTESILATESCIGSIDLFVTNLSSMFWV